MYREYEDLRKLERLLEEAETAYEEAREKGEDGVDEYQWVEELKERINFAWQDNEYEWLVSKEDTYAYERFVEERED